MNLLRLATLFLLLFGLIGFVSAESSYVLSFNLDNITKSDTLSGPIYEVTLAPDNNNIIIKVPPNTIIIESPSNGIESNWDENILWGFITLNKGKIIQYHSSNPILIKFQYVDSNAIGNQLLDLLLKQ